MKYLLAIVASVLLAACSNKPAVEGTYVDMAGKEAFTFTADGKVHRGDKVTKYAITDGNTVSFYFDGSLPFQGKIAQDGSIVWGAFIFTKK